MDSFGPHGDQNTKATKPNEAALKNKNERDQNSQDFILYKKAQEVKAIEEVEISGIPPTKESEKNPYELNNQTKLNNNQFRNINTSNQTYLSIKQNQ